MFMSLLFILTMTKSKRKAELAANSDSQQPVKRASHSSAKLNTQLAKATRPIQWKENNMDRPPSGILTGECEHSTQTLQ